MQFNRCCLYRFFREHYQENKNISLLQEIHGLDQVSNMNYQLRQLSAGFNTIKNKNLEKKTHVQVCVGFFLKCMW